MKNLAKFTQCLKSVEGILYQVFSVLCFSALSIISRVVYKTTQISPLEVLLWRSIVHSIFNFFFVFPCKIDIIAIPQKVSGILGIRLVTGVTAVFGYFIGNYVLPPSIATAVGKLSPLLTTIFSVFMLHERVSRIEIIGMITAFAGILLITFDPMKVHVSLSAYLAQLYLFFFPIVNAICSSFSAVFVRMLGQSLHCVISPTYLCLASTIAAFPVILGYLSVKGFIAIYSTRDWILLILIGLTGWAGQITSSRALQIEKAGRIAAINFDTVVLLFFDIFYFGEIISPIEIFGIMLIMITVIGIALLKGCQCVT